MRKMIPDFAEEHQYRHPGPIHTQFGRYVNEPGDYTSMNTDGHLRSVFFGRSETMTIKDGILDGGEFAHIYFIDWDHVRARHRQLNVTVMGTTEDVNDRKFQAARPSTPSASTPTKKKAHDVHYTLQLDARVLRTSFHRPNSGQPGPGDFCGFLLTSVVYSCRIALHSATSRQEVLHGHSKRSMRRIPFLPDPMEAQAGHRSAAGEALSGAAGLEADDDLHPSSSGWASAGS